LDVRGTARLAVVAAFVAGAVAGCGELGASFRGTRSDEPPALTQADVDRAGAGTPARALLGWCRVLQRSDMAAAKRLYASGLPPADVRRDVLGGVFTFRQITCPAVTETAVHGDRAVVFAEIATRRVAPNGRIDQVVRPHAFNLRRDGARWTIVPGSFLSGLAFPPARPGERIVRPRLVREADLRRYPVDSPERGALELLQLLQYDDPTAALPRFGPAFALTSVKLAKQLDELGGVARSWGAPRAVRVTRRGDVATIHTVLGHQPSTVVLHRHAGVWQLVHYRIGRATGPRAEARSHS
jgi:hypothetical protein